MLDVKNMTNEDCVRAYENIKRACAELCDDMTLDEINALIAEVRRERLEKEKNKN